jgi:diacylglycerol kinase (ATP)
MMEQLRDGEVAGGAAKGREGRRAVVIVNPNAAGGEAGARWPELERALREVLGGFEVRLTDARGAATRLTREALREGYDLICSLGGDGTHNEVVNGFFDQGAALNPDAALGILPFGTGGDFRRTLGLSGDMREAALRIAHSAPRRCDLGRLRFVNHEGGEDERIFLNIASFGISGLVDQKVNSSSKALGGAASFFIGTVRALSEYSPQQIHMVIDDRLDIQVEINNVAVANGRYFGGGMKIAPYAELGDGLFDLAIIRDMAWTDLVLGGVRLYEGRHFEAAQISHLQARKVTAEPRRQGEEVLLDVDGEAPGRLPATFEVMPGAIWLLA